MNKCKKILLIFICIFLAICHINNKIYAFTINEVKDIVDFKTVEENGAPKDYDVLVDASEFIGNERIPCIQSSANKVLYSDEGFYAVFDINFLNNDSTNSNEKWNNINNIVKTGFKVTLYFSIAITLTLFICMGISMVYSSISQKESILPFEKFIRKNSKYRSHTSKTKEKRFVEQWLITIFILCIVPYVISLVLFATDFFRGTYLESAQKLIDEDSYIVYVKNSKINNSTSISSSIVTSDSDSDEEELNQLRQKVVEQASSMDNLEVPSGLSQMWIELVYETALNIEIPEQCCAHGAAINSIFSTSTEDIPLGAAVFSYTSIENILDMSCGEDEGQAGIYIGDGKIATYTGSGDTGVEIFSIEEWQENWDFSGWGWLPGLNHLSNGQRPTNSTSTTSENISYISYYFKSNIEGVLMFQSQYNWEEHSARNIANMLAGFLVSLFKIYLMAIFTIRTAITAFFIIIAPILILINGYLQIVGNKGFLKNYFILFIAMVLFKPLVEFFYYIFMNNNNSNFAQNPIYLLIVILAVVAFTYIYIKMLIQRFKIAKKTNIVNKRV